ncbi:MAG TPA: hypothetical protein VK066_29350 [Chloroflexota bacterium]|nr:hypothetical protein [Chloroflexota bacterium]
MPTVMDERYEEWLAAQPDIPMATIDLKRVWGAAWEGALAAVLAQAPTDDAATDALAAWRDTMASQDRPVAPEHRTWPVLDERDREVWHAIAARAVSGAVHRVRERPESTAA